MQFQLHNPFYFQVQQLYSPQPAPCSKGWVDLNDADHDLDIGALDPLDCAIVALCLWTPLNLPRWLATLPHPIRSDLSFLLLFVM